MSADQADLDVFALSARRYQPTRTARRTEGSGDT